MSILNATSRVTYPYFKAINSDFFMMPEVLDTKDYFNEIECIMKELPVSKDNITNKESSILHINYTLKHKLAIMALSYEFLGYISKRIILHDTEKLVLYTMMDSKSVSTLHRNYSIHHSKNLLQGGPKAAMMNRRESIFDYECARYTKPDKPLNAYETIKKYFPSDFKDQENILREFGICSSEKKDCDFKKWDCVSGLYIPVFEELTISAIHSLKSFFSNNPIDAVMKGYNDYLLSYEI